MTTDLTQDSFNEVVKVSNKDVLVDFYATWCGPCNQMAPILEDIGSEYEDQILVAKIDVDEYPEVAKEHGVKGLPTLIVFREGEVYKWLVGARSKDQLLEDLGLK